MRTDFDLRAALHATFGVLDRPRGVAVVTCMKPMFNSLYKAFAGNPRRHKGWWRLEVYPSVSLCFITQGSAISDCIRVLSVGHGPVVYFGLAGGLNDSLTLGSVFCVSRALYKGRARLSPMVLRGFDFGPVLHADGMLEYNRSHLENARRQGVWGIEMECWHAFRASREYGVTCAAVMVVSDLPLTRPFYSLSPEDLRRVSAGMNIGARQIAEAVDIERHQYR